MPPWLWTVLRQSSIYCIVLCRLGARSGTRPCPVQRTVPCRSSECRGFGGCDRLHCRKTSECEGREKLLQTAIFSEQRQELRVPPMPSFPPAPSKTLSTPSSDWKAVSESERVNVGVRQKRKHFIYSGFLSRRHQVSNWKRWQCLLIVDEWHLCRLSILLLLLELSKMSKLCLSISQILPLAASQHYQT